MKAYFLILYVFYIWVSSAQGEEYLVRFKTPEGFHVFMGGGLAKLTFIQELFGGKIKKAFSFGSFCGLTVDISLDVMKKLRRNSLIAEVVPNISFNAFDDDGELKESYNEDECNESFDGEGPDDEDADEEEEYRLIGVQFNAPRHLARLSRRSQLPYDANKQPDSERFSYYYNNNYQGEGVNVYIIDTGVRENEEEFEERLVFGQDFTGEGPGDLNGHGTHVAGIVGSRQFGVAKNVNLIDVKALDSRGQGNLTTVISSIEFALEHCKENSNRRACIANLSLGSMRNSVINQAVKAAFDEGLLMVTAAGNSNINACWTSPASAPEAIAVGAFDDRTDTIAKFSNWGPCVDVFASGVKVRSLSNSDSYNSVKFSGTSMSSPVVAGLCAILIDHDVAIEDIKEKIIDLSTTGVFQRRTLLLKPGTPNKVIFNGIEKNDDKFENAIYPIVDLESFIEVLNNYQPDDIELDFEIKDDNFVVRQ